MMLELQDKGCQNINFVTPEHVVRQILEALAYAIDAGLRLPTVYNTARTRASTALRYGRDCRHLHARREGVERRTGPPLLRMPDYPEVTRATIRRWPDRGGTRPW